MKSLTITLLRAKLGIFLCIFVGLTSSAYPQGAVAPERTQLLNGLRVILLPRTGDQEVLVKLRIHSGSAFDLAGKAGTTALLGDILFPDPSTREYFTEDMQGRLNVAADYDAITVTMVGRARDFERIIETLRTAIVTTQLTPENFSKVRDGRIKVAKDTSNSPTMLADRAIAARLFGEFPYGRPAGGSIESLDRVERADLMLARDRFMNPNNATLVMIGGVQAGRAMRTLRQLLGGWRKSEEIIPATFRQPGPPDSRTLVINAPSDQSVEVRLAVRGLARKDPDSLVADLLAQVIRQRLEKSMMELARMPVFVRHESYSLPGMFVIGATIEHLLAGKFLNETREVVTSLASAPVSSGELEQARQDVLLARNKALPTAEGQADSWLDGDTYGVSPVPQQLSAIRAATPADLQRVASRLFGDLKIASIVVGNADLIKASVERYAKIELLGEVESKKPASPSQPAKPDSKTGSKPD